MSHPRGRTVVHRSYRRNNREGFNLAVDLFYGYDGKNSELDLSIYLGGGPGKNTCNTKPKEICTADAIKKGTICEWMLTPGG